MSIYNAKTLTWKRDLPWVPESGQVEVSRLAVDREKNMVWMSDWVDGKILFTSDDSESMYQIPDNIYIADMPEVPYSGLKEGIEVVKDTPFSVKLDKKGMPVIRKGKIAAGAMSGKIVLGDE